MTAIARAVSALQGLSLGAFVLATACEPQNIYLFDRPPTETRVGPDSGTSTPPPSEVEDPEDAEEPDDEEDDDAPAQPACISYACDVCVDDALCDVAGGPSFCHPESGQCRLWCEPEAAISEANACPSAAVCHPDFRLCVECVSDGDCSGSTGICDARNVCVGCEDRTDCPTAALPACDPASLVCVECLANDDCIGGGEDTVCSPGDHLCVECINDNDCIAKDPLRPICTPERECEDGDDD